MNELDGGRMDVEIGRDRYEVVDGFFRRPKGWTFVEVADVGIDPDDNVYVFCRGSHPVMIFDRDGRFLDAWGEMGGENYFTFPHGLSVGLDGFVYTADSRDHSVRKWTKDGRHVLTLGSPHQNAPAFSGKPFNRPTHATAAANGDIYVSDGYGNARIHCFSPDGELKFSWGAPGHGPGEFNTVHSVFIDPDDDTLYAADRFNNRVQFFTLAGEYLGEWANLRLPQSVRKGPDGTFHVAELSHRITVLDRDGSVLARWGDGVEVDDAETGGVALALPGAPSRNPMVRGRVRNEPGPGLFCAPHGIAVDSAGSFYVAESSESWIGLDRGSRSIQKFVRR
jgi:DNA-binding beta-propeller fold protein YncE